MSDHDPSVPASAALSIVSAWAVVVGSESPHIDGVVVVGRSAESDPVTPVADLVQPGQLWLLIGDHPEIEHVLTTENATVVRCTEDEVIRRLAEHAIARYRAADERLVDAMRETTILRRELNHALSALSKTHPVLGLMPSTTARQFNQQRTPALPLKPWDPDALMTTRTRPNLSDDEVTDLMHEVDELRRALSAVRNTRLMRWTTGPRRAYGFLRHSTHR